MLAKLAIGPRLVLLAGLLSVPLSGVPVTFSVGAGNGTLAPGGPVLTDYGGIARADWTLPPTEGTWTATATIDVLTKEGLPNGQAS